jgi:hypothetical protein
MARKQSHYMVDFFYPQVGAVDGFRKEPHRIVANSDTEAIKESKIAAIGTPRGRPAFFRLRKVYRMGDEVIYDSSKGPHA